MLFEVIVDMANKNALIALAYITENDNPLAVFCTYILYCLSRFGKSLRYDELTSRIESEFGLRYSTQMFKVCLRILQKERKIEVLPKGAGYVVVEAHAVDVDSFDKKRSDFMEKENHLINQLILYVARQNCSWNIDEARQHLTNFLVYRENAARLFTDGSVESPIKENCISPEWYVGGFVTEALQSRSSISEYLLEIIKGLMVFIGVHETDDYQQDREQKFRGTDFYVDTKLLLRAMGFSWDLEVEAAKEMLHMIRNEYGGNLCVFDHTVGEITSALSTAAHELSKNGGITNFELRVFASAKKFTSADFEISANSVRKKITAELGLRIQPGIQWNDSEWHHHNLDWGVLTQHIRDEHPLWNSRAIDNDVTTLNYINFLRKGDYSLRFGGKKKLPIFITSNTALVRDIRQYITSNAEADKGVANWDANALPIVSDNMIMCRLWVPKANSHTALPALELARNAFAAQQGNAAYYEQYRRSARDLQQKHNIDVINISEIRKRKLDELIITKVAGKIDDITPELIASTVEELIGFETMELKNNVQDLETENRNHILVIEQQRQQIIQSSSARFANRVGLKRLLIYAAEFWWLINTLVFGGCVLGLAYVKGIPFISNAPYFGIAYIVLSLLFKALEKALINSKVTEWWLQKAVPYVWIGYANRVEKSLIRKENEVKGDILLACLEETPIFNRHRKYIQHDSMCIGEVENVVIEA